MTADRAVLPTRVRDESRHKLEAGHHKVSAKATRHEDSQPGERCLLSLPNRDATGRGSASQWAANASTVYASRLEAALILEVFPTVWRLIL